MTSNASSSPRPPDAGPTILRPVDLVLSPEDIEVCVQAFRRGGLLAFPTDTVYGVGADAGSREAVRRLFEAKARPPDKALPVLVAGPDGVRACVRDVLKTAWILMEAFWPGPLTLVLRRTGAICPEAVAGGDTVGLRMPDHPVALQLLSAVGLPMAVTSANLSGDESTISAEEVLRTLGRWLDVLVEDPSSGSGLPSTVIDLTTSPPRILRQGAITREQLASVIAEVCGPDPP